jgi:hypothetical protein
MSELQQP